MLEAIVAVYSDWGIGCDGTQPVILKADRRHFQTLTNGSAILYGRKTMEDFPGGNPLPNRINILLSRQVIQKDSVILVHSVEEALQECDKYPNVFLVGGSSTFMQFLPHICKAFVTKIDICPHSDSFFPNLDDDPHWIIRAAGAQQYENGIPYQFLLYERSKA